MPKYYPINEEAAKRAKDMNSFSDYQPGSATAGYRAMVDEAYAAAERQKARVDPMYHDKIDALVDRYARKLAENLNERNVIDARVPSILISGGEAKINEAENRLQLIFEEKPDANQRQELKSNGFKWAPSQGAWQRQLNQNAIRAAARIDFLRPEDGTSPYQLQPFVKRENKEMSR